MRTLILVLWAVVALPGAALADGHAPYGTAKAQAVDYPPAKVLYDVYRGGTGKIANIFDRISMLQNLYGADPFDASIIVVLHGDAIPVFATRNTEKYAKLMERADSLTRSGVIEFRMCGASAKLRGFDAKDIHGFVTMVPMADAEIVRLQNMGYVYMQ